MRVITAARAKPDVELTQGELAILYRARIITAAITGAIGADRAADCIAEACRAYEEGFQADAVAAGLESQPATPEAPNQPPAEQPNGEPSKRGRKHGSAANA